MHTQIAQDILFGFLFGVGFSIATWALSKILK